VGKGINTSWLEQKQERLRAKRSLRARDKRRFQRELEWIRMSPKARHAKGKARSQLRGNAGPTIREKRREESRDSTFHQVASWRRRYPSPKVSQGLWEHLLVEDMPFQLPPGAIVGVIGPNGAGRLRSSMITGQESPIRARFGRRDGRACLCRSERTLESEQINLGRNLRRDRSLKWEHGRLNSARMLGDSTFQARNPRRKSNVAGGKETECISQRFEGKCECLCSTSRLTIWMLYSAGVGRGPRELCVARL